MSPTPSATAADGFTLAVDEDMPLLVHAGWPVDPAATDSWVEYRFEGDAWLLAPTIAPGTAVILGIPAESSVEARAAQVVDGQTRYTSSLDVTTGSLPDALLVPEVTAYDASLASSAPYAMISVACGPFPYAGPYFLEIFDRSGRVVWYHEVPDQMFSWFPTIARDGTHIWYEAEDVFGMGSGDPQVTRQPLDGRWQTSLPLLGLGEAIAEGPDESFFFEQRTRGSALLDQVDAAGDISTLWDCGAWFDTLGLDPGTCLMNTCNWDPAHDTVLASQFETSTVFEIDVATGLPIRQMGELPVGDPWAFDPPESNFAYQHDPHWTPDGTLFVSTHVPCATGDCLEYNIGGGQTISLGLYGVQLASEYAVDDATKTLTLLSSYESDDLWARQAGEAYQLPNGNIVQGYGQNGAVREVTADGSVAWQVVWPTDLYGSRFVGHVSLIDDLYALDGGPP